jgi:predicted ATPase
MQVQTPIRSLSVPQHLPSLMQRLGPERTPGSRTPDGGTPDRVPAGDRPAARGRNAPPAPLTSFVGRDADLCAVDDLLTRFRVLTLHGPGGVGKTRLALHAARRVGSRFAAGVVWVQLASLAHQDDVPYTVADALGVCDLGAEQPLEALAAAVGDGSVLLVLDDCDHVLAAVADLVECLVGRCPGVSVLITSREPIGVAGDHLLPVGPLGTDDAGGDPLALPAVRLLCDRLTAARGRALDDAELRDAVTLARRLDGLPLALELAAARAAALGVRQLTERAGTDVLDGGRSRRTGQARHRSLRAVVQWSHDLLEDDEKKLFARLSVFAGPFDLARAEAVCSDAAVPAARIGALLAGLVDRSLVVGAREVADGRYRLLTTLREVAAEQLQALGESERWQLSHAAHLVEVTASRAAALTMTSTSCGQSITGRVIGPPNRGTSTPHCGSPTRCTTSPAASCGRSCSTGPTRPPVSRASRTTPCTPRCWAPPRRAPGCVETLPAPASGRAPCCGSVPTRRTPAAFAPCSRWRRSRCCPAGWATPPGGIARRPRSRTRPGWLPRRWTPRAASR